MKNSPKDFAFTLTILSQHKLNFGYTLDRKDKTLFKDLEEKKQEAYMSWLLTSSVSMVLDELEIALRLSYIYETHPNIKCVGGISKRHAHGVLYGFTVEQIDQFKDYVYKYLKITHSKKFMDVCLKVVPINYHHGWITYMEKDMVMAQMELDLAELENPQPEEKIISHIDYI